MNSTQYAKYIVLDFDKQQRSDLMSRLLELINIAKREERVRAIELREEEQGNTKPMYSKPVNNEKLEETGEDIVQDVMSVNPHEDSMMKLCKILDRLPGMTEFKISIIPEPMLMHLINRCVDIGDVVIPEDKNFATFYIKKEVV